MSLSLTSTHFYSNTGLLQCHSCTINSSFAPKLLINQYLMDFPFPPLLLYCSVPAMPSHGQWDKLSRTSVSLSVFFLPDLTFPLLSTYLESTHSSKYCFQECHTFPTSFGLVESLLSTAPVNTPWMPWNGLNTLNKERLSVLYVLGLPEGRWSNLRYPSTSITTLNCEVLNKYWLNEQMWISPSDISKTA